ncbi:MAG: hypothetical protein COA54_03345 [Thiotrichaceae bacterium]|nr:MAG: hypothetical protein COA54_03345 [Thiotrichaceae bacterium]
MQNVEMSIVETGDAAIVNTRKKDTIIFESGNVYRLYGRKSEQKVKLIGESKSPDFNHWDEHHFQRHYSYVGVAKVVKIKRTLKIQMCAA